MLKIDKTGYYHQKRVFRLVFTAQWALRSSRLLCSRSVRPRLRFALVMAKTAKRAITCLVPRHISN